MAEPNKPGYVGSSAAFVAPALPDFSSGSPVKTEPKPEPKPGPVSVASFGVGFEELIESIYDAVLLTTIEGAAVKFNERLVDFFGYSEEELAQLNILSLVCGADEELLDTILYSVLEQRRVFIEAFGLRKDQSEFPIEIAVSKIHLGGDGQHLCFMIRNITVRKETEEALEKARQELVESAHRGGMADIATGVLHNVGNIVNSINVSCEVALSSLQSEAVQVLEKANDLVQSQENVGEFLAKDPRAQKLPLLYVKVAEMLRTERDKLSEELSGMREKLSTVCDVISVQQEYAKAGLFMEEVDVNQVVEDSLGIMDASITRHQVSLDKQLADDLPLVKANKSKLVHVLVNLMGNAKDAMRDVPPRERLLRVQTSFIDGDVLLSVTDTGEGIAPDNLEKVFNHGYTTKPNGHGFGLHTCANFMTEMGGEIWAESEGTGKGASFVVRIPLEAEKEEDAQ